MRETPQPPGNEQSSDPPVRDLVEATFGFGYFALAMFCVALPAAAGAQAIWLGNGLLLGALLVSPPARWGWLAVQAFAISGFTLMLTGQSFDAIAGAAAVAVAGPVLVATGILRLGGSAPVRLDNLAGMTTFLVNLIPLLAVTSALGAGFAWLRQGMEFRSAWTSVYVSDALSAILFAPFVLLWARGGWREVAGALRGRTAEVVVLFAGLVIATHLVFRARPDASLFIAPVAFLCFPFLIWAALRFGLRAATLALVLSGLVSYWHTARGLGPFAPVGSDWRALVYLQAYLATMVVTTLFAAALLAEREAEALTTEAWRRRHKAAIEASGNLLYEFDPDTGRLLWDGDTMTVLGVAPGEVATYEQFFARVHDEDRARLETLRGQVLLGDLPNFAVEFRLQRGDGEWITVGVNGFEIDDPTVTRAGRRIIGFVKDITERLRAEQERAALAAQLKQAEKMEAVGRLAGGIAHDFNNILGAILGYGELAQMRAESDPEMKRYIDTMVGAGNRAKALVSQILAYSRADSGVREPVDLNGVLEEVCDLIKGSAPAGIEVRLALPREAAMVSGDPTRLHQLAMNLASNAVQAMPGGGTLGITVSLRHLASPLHTRLAEVAPGDYVVLEVKDSGEGIRPEVIDRIFEPFFTTKPAGRGTGLGLALVHSVARDHGGAIDLASEVGHGTTFTIWLPRLQVEAAAAEPETAASAGSGQIVLLVDDEPEMLAALEEMLASQGYEPAGYTDAHAALAAFRADPHRFDAVISDERMPGIAGTELALELRKSNGEVPIIIATGFGGEGFDERARAAGISRILRKPYRMQEVAAALGEVLGAR